MASVRLRPEDLRRAIADDALSLHYMPQVHVTEGRLDGVEAFVRWPHPALGLVGPADIVGLVAQGGLHADFDAWVIATAARQLGDWRQRGVVVPLASVSVWPESLRTRGFAERVTEMIRGAHVAPEAIELKCPRDAISDRTLTEPLRRCEADGVRLATDAMVEGDPDALRFDTLKIPPPLVQDLVAKAEVVRTIVAAAAQLGARAVAEGVETAAQQDALIGLGCHVVQGYLYGPEVSADEIAALVVREERPR